MRTGIRMQRSSLGAQQAKQLQYPKSRHHLVVPLQQKSHGYPYVRRVPAASRLPFGPQTPIKPRTAARIRGSARYER